MVFTGVGSYRCEKCRFTDYDDYGKVRNYVEEHRGASVAQVADATGVEQRLINELLREERLEIASDSKVFLKCEGCGREIRYGRYCSECAKLEAAARMRKDKQRKKEEEGTKISGVGMVQETSSGAKRFERKR